MEMLESDSITLLNLMRKAAERYEDAMKGMVVVIVDGVGLVAVPEEDVIRLGDGLVIVKDSHIVRGEM